MAIVWADDIPDSTPLLQLEAFYILVALELGDPEGDRLWLHKNQRAFHNLYKQHCQGMTAAERFERLPVANAVLLQYFLWYSRERPRG